MPHQLRPAAPRQRWPEWASPRRVNRRIYGKAEREGERQHESQSAGNGNHRRLLMEEFVKATDLLKDLGFPTAVIRGGAAKVLGALVSLNIKPAHQRVVGGGVQFLVTKQDCATAKAGRLSVAAHEPPIVGRSRRDIRTVARAVLDLYERLGEEPQGKSNLRHIAES